MDLETGYYYLQSRYYDLEIGAFISPDSIMYLNPESIGGLNLYAYCLNNPVMYYDPSGNSAFLIGIIVGIIVGVGIGVGFVTYLDYQDDGEIFNGSIGWETYLAAALIGGAIGGLLGGYIIPYLSTTSFSIPTGLKIVECASAGIPMIVSAGAVTISGTQVLIGTSALGATYMFYERKLAAPRIKCKSKKEAFQKAFQKGGKKPPIKEKNKIHGPHFHPNVPKGHKFQHWHYYYLWILGLLGLRESE